MERFFRILLILSIVGLVFLSVKVRSSCIELEAAIGRARLMKKAMLNEQKMLMAERERFLSLQRVRYLASKKLGLEEIDRKKVVFVVDKTHQQGPVDVNYILSMGRIN